MSTARLATQMRMAVAGTRAFHVVECSIPAFYTGNSAGAWSLLNDHKARKPDSRQTTVSQT